NTQAQHDSTFELPPCDFCGNTQFRLGVRGPDFRVAGTGEYQLYECLSCGLATLQPPLAIESLAQHYPDWLWQNELSRSPSAPAKLIVALETLQRWHAAPGVLLDVGCGPGDFVLLAQQAG